MVLKTDSRFYVVMQWNLGLYVWDTFISVFWFLTRQQYNMTLFLALDHELADAAIPDSFRNYWALLWSEVVKIGFNQYGTFRVQLLGKLFHAIDEIEVAFPAVNADKQKLIFVPMQ